MFDVLETIGILVNESCLWQINTEKPDVPSRFTEKFEHLRVVQSLSFGDALLHIIGPHLDAAWREWILFL